MTTRMTYRKTTSFPSKFYDALASDYDEMTGFSQRFAKELPSFRAIVKQYGLKTALDAGCGTGFHSILLTQLGLKVVATDISEKMLIQTRHNARKLGLKIKTIASPFSMLNKVVPNKFDSVFCLGNTLAHFLTKQELIGSLKSFYEVMNSGGILFLQILNYNRILTACERIQSIKETDDKIFVRFYDYEKEIIRFNILTIEKSKDGITHTLHTVPLRPWIATDIVNILRRVGFCDVKLFGSIAMDKYNALTSKDIVILAHHKK